MEEIRVRSVYDTKNDGSAVSEADNVQNPLTAAIASIVRKNTTVTQASLDTIVSQVQKVLQAYEVRALAERVQRRGADSVLLAMADLRLQEWIYLYGNDERFNRDIRFLRSEGLIQYAYDDISKAEITSSGYAVVSAIRPGDNDVFIPPFSEFVGGTNLEPSTYPSELGDLQELSAGRQTIRLGAQPVWLKFNVPEPGTYTITAEANAGDTVMWLLQHDLSGGLLLMDMSDDIGGSFNSRIERSLPSGTYLVAVRDFNLASVSAVVEFSRMPPQDPEPLSPPQE